LWNRETKTRRKLLSTGRSNKNRPGRKKGIVSNKSYIPDRETELNAWLTNFLAVATNNATPLHLTTAQITALTALIAAYNTCFTDNVSYQAQARAAREAKDEAKRQLLADIRPMVRVIQANSTIPDSLREQLAITVPKTDKTPVPVPTSSPMPQVEQIEEFFHVLRVSDSATNKVAKPFGVDGSEIWMKIVPAGDPAPISPSDLAFAGFATHSKVTREFSAADVGKTAYYRLRYVNTKGQTGPWGNQVGATIAA
jgi:hypothetical protein